MSAAGFDDARETFFIWLGVVLYLSADAVRSTLHTIAGVRGGAHVVFDYGEPREVLPSDQRAARDRYATRVAALGEPWITAFEPATLHADLRALGFGEIEDLGPRDLVARYAPHVTTPAPEKGGHVLRATTRTQNP